MQMDILDMKTLDIDLSYQILLSFFLLSRDGVAGLPPEIDGGFRANV